MQTGVPASTHIVIQRSAGVDTRPAAIHRQGHASMILFPDIEIQDGRSVNRIRGTEDEPHVYRVSPLDAARAFAAAVTDRHLIMKDPDQNIIALDSSRGSPVA